MAKTRLIIKNKTNYRTRELRKLITLALRIEKKNERRKLLELKVTIVYRGRVKHKGHLTNEEYKKYMIEQTEWDQKYAPRGYGGNAWLGYGIMELRVPEECCEYYKVADVFYHEMQHVWGFGHGKFTDQHDLSPFKNWGLLPENPPKPIILKPVVEKPPKPKKDLQISRYEKVLANIKQKTTRVKRLQTSLKKLKKKQKYYEKALIAAKKLDPNQ